MNSKLDLHYAQICVIAGNQDLHPIVKWQRVSSAMAAKHGKVYALDVQSSFSVAWLTSAGLS
jgi:hypothetical protein